MTDVNVQFFSHSNGLTLNNNWGDLIRMLDITLVNGKSLPSVLLIDVDTETGDVTVEFSANHGCKLFQVIEFTGFTPSDFNKKYRIKGIVNNTTVLLKNDNKELKVTLTGIVKLAPLGYEIIFRDDADVKRVYRAKNPTSNHPYIRVDESITSEDGISGVYTSTYAKSAMVGLFSKMDHIDDIENPTSIYLPYNGTDPKRNWRITGTGTSCSRGWSKWYWAQSSWWSSSESSAPTNHNRQFSVIGDRDAFYFTTNFYENDMMVSYGCGLYNDLFDIDYPWFLGSYYQGGNVTVNNTGNTYFSPFSTTTSIGHYKVTNITSSSSASVDAHNLPISDIYQSGTGNKFSNDVPAITHLIIDTNKVIRGSLKHLHIAGKKVNESRDVTVISSGNSMYVWHLNSTWPTNGGYYYYLGELQ